MNISLKVLKCLGRCVLVYWMLTNSIAQAENGKLRVANKNGQQAEFLLNKGSSLKEIFETLTQDPNFKSENITYLEITGDCVKHIPGYVFNCCHNLKKIKIPDSVTLIEENAFSYCTSLTQVEFGEVPSLRTIGPGAFMGCLSLTEIDIPLTVESIEENAFNRCGLKKLEILGNVTTIKQHAFGDCTNLSEVDFKSGVNEIGSEAFANCINLEKIEIARSVNFIGNGAFKGCSKLTHVLFNELKFSKLSTIGVQAFWGCKSLQEITIPSNVNFIGNGAFGECIELSQVNFGGSKVNSNLSIIGAQAFYNCKHLSRITIPDNVNRIGIQAFWGCESLQEITIPKNVVLVGMQAFGRCKNLTQIDILGNNVIIGPGVITGCSSLQQIGNKKRSSFSEILFLLNSSLWSSEDVHYKTYIYKNENELNSNCLQIKVTYENGKKKTFSGFDKIPENLKQNIVSVIIKGEVVDIPPHAFENFKNLEEVNCTDGVVSIGAYAFGGCSSLTKLKLPPSLNIVEEGAFWGCSSLSEFTLHSTLILIESGAFAGCENLSEIKTLEDWNYATIGAGAFLRCDSLERFGNKDVEERLFLYNYASHLNKDMFLDFCFYKNGEANSSKDLQIKVTCENGEKQTFSGFDKIPENLKQNIVSVIIEGDVVHILPHAFENFKNLKSVKFSEGVVSIGEYAFAGCENLSEIKFPFTSFAIERYAFRNCKTLAKIEILSTLTIVEEGAFADCKNLTSFVLIGNLVMRTGVFAGCNCLKQFREGPFEGLFMPSSSFVLREPMFLNTCVYNKNGNAEALKITVSYKNNKKKIFSNFDKIPENSKKNIVSVTISGMNVHIPPHAFKNFKNLKSVKFSKGVVSIGSYAFKRCCELEAIEFKEPSCVTSIGYGAFLDCKKLTQVTIPPSVITIEGQAFFGCTCLERVNIPSNSLLNSIGQEAFLGCENLTSITFPLNLSDIGAYAFKYCRNLTQVVIPSSRTCVDPKAFSKKHTNIICSEKELLTE